MTAVRTLAATILNVAQALPEGSVLAPKEFLHLASRAAVDQALSRLVRRGKLLRVGRGLYVQPIDGRFGTRPPAPEKVVETIAEKSGDIVVSHGAAAANALGLTTQVPVREIFLTSGRSRKLRLGARTIEMKHAPRWQLALGKRPAGMAVRALLWLGEEHAHRAITILREQLPEAEWRALTSFRAAMPSWMATAVGAAGE